MHDDSCPACAGSPLERRKFLTATATAAVALPWIARSGLAAPTRKSAAESLVGEFHASLSEMQRKTVCMPFSDPNRSKVHANWHVTKPLIGSDFFTDSQRAIIDKIVKSLTSKEGHERLTKQMEDDDGGLNAYSVALFGDPSGSEFQWVLTGRHLTLRADGDTLPKAAFGGGVVYGHGEESKADANLFFYQTQKVNEVFKALDANQSKQALLTKIPAESDIKIRGAGGTIPGLAVSSLSNDQKGLVRECLKTVLSPYRPEDGDEAMKLIDSAGGIDALRLAFYSDGDLGNDKVWDNWRIEGPTSVIHFRGAPHVHAYINIAG